MRAFNLLFAAMLVLTGCSSLESDYASDFDRAVLLDRSLLETDLPIVEITIAPSDWAKLRENFLEDIDFDAVIRMERGESVCIPDQPAQIEIKGGKSASFDLKSLGLKFNPPLANLDDEIISSDLTLPQHSLDSIWGLRLRNSGNDFAGSLIKDLAYTQLAIDAGLNVDLMYGLPALVYVNGNFYGLMNLRTEGNTRGVAGLYSVRPENITLAKMERGGSIVVKDGDADRVAQLLDDIEIGNREAVVAQFDLDNLIDYFAYESLIGNYDWPDNNVRFAAVMDGPFRFVLFDLDLAATKNIDNDPMWFIQSGDDNAMRDMFLLLYSDPAFAERFHLRLEELYHHPALQPEHFVKVVDDLRLTILDEVPLQIERYATPSSMLAWRTATDEVISLYERRHYALARKL